MARKKVEETETVKNVKTNSKESEKLEKQGKKDKGGKTVDGPESADKEAKIKVPVITKDNKVKIKMPPELQKVPDMVTVIDPNDPDSTIEVALYGYATMSKDVAVSMIKMSKEHITNIVKTYDAHQKYRKSVYLQIIQDLKNRAEGRDENNLIGLDENPDETIVTQNSDDEVEKTYSQLYNDDGSAKSIDIPLSEDNTFPVFLYENLVFMEKQTEKVLKTWVENDPMGQYLTSIKGIGPIFAAKLIAYLNIDRTAHPSAEDSRKIVHHRSAFYQYCGLNDNNCPWLGTDKAYALVDEAYRYCDLKSSDDPTPELFAYLAKKSGRRVGSIIKGATIKPSKKRDATEEDNKDVGKITKRSLAMFLAMPPYNINLKPIMYLIGNSFMFNANRGSKYGQLYLERKAFELQNNEDGVYAEQAAQKLKEKRYGKGTVTYKALSEGKLSNDHITQRAKRKAVTIFISHVYEAMYYYRFHEVPPEPYQIQYMGHQEYITPEVDYISFFNKYWKEHPEKDPLNQK